MERVSCTFQTDNKNKFKIGASNYATQYNNLYTNRTKIMKQKLTELVKAKWGDSCKLAEKIIDTETNTGDDAGKEIKEQSPEITRLKQLIGIDTIREMKQ